MGFGDLGLGFWRFGALGLGILGLGLRALELGSGDFLGFRVEPSTPKPSTRPSGRDAPGTSRRPEASPALLKDLALKGDHDKET